MNSLDPRVNRLPELGDPGLINPKGPLDQFGTFEVFVQPRKASFFQHEGVVHAPNLEMAFILAKETFTRRFACTSLYVAETRSIFVSPMTEGIVNAYDCMPDMAEPSGQRFLFEIYHLLKRGKQHIQAGSVHAVDHQHAMQIAKKQLNRNPVFNVWAIRTTDIRYTTPEENDLWLTLPEKKFRDASDYKGGDKLKEFLARNIQD